MPNKQHTQSEQIALPRRDSSRSVLRPRSGVRQDNPTQPPAPLATPQPAPPKKDRRPATKKTNTSRTRQKTSRIGKKVKLDLWVNPRLKAELQRVAKGKDLSVSTTGEALLEYALQQNLYMQHAALLDPIINKAIRKHMRAYSNRLAFLLVRVAFASEQTRSLVTNLFTYQVNITPEKLNAILDGSSKAAKRKITERTPQLQSIIDELEKIFIAEGEGDESK